MPSSWAHWNRTLGSGVARHISRSSRYYTSCNQKERWRKGGSTEIWSWWRKAKWAMIYLGVDGLYFSSASVCCLLWIKALPSSTAKRESGQVELQEAAIPNNGHVLYLERKILPTSPTLNFLAKSLMYVSPPQQQMLMKSLGESRSVNLSCQRIWDGSGISQCIQHVP